MSNNQLSHKTIFVQGIPASCNNDQLNEVFSVFGGIKESFVVKSKTLSVDSNSKQQFYGFVTFQTAEDSKSCLNSNPKDLIINGVQVKVSIARKKPPKSSKNKAPQNRKEPSKKVDDDDKIKNENNVTETKKSKDFVVVIAGLPDNCDEQDLTNILTKKYIKFKTAEVNLKTQEGHVHLNNKQDALKLISRLNGTSLNGVSLIKAILVLDEDSKEYRKSSKKSRLIIRNLNFNCKEKDLREVFERFGKITDIKIPTKSNGQMFGYGFVQFTHVLEATKALQAINMTMINERKVAVDWALPREKFKQMSNTTEAQNKAKDIEEEEASEDSDHASGDEEDSANFSDDDKEEDQKEEKESDSYSEDETDSEEEEDKIDDDKDVKIKKENLQKKQPNYSSDVHEGKTVFLRNISFDAVEEELADEMMKFGEIKYCKIVMNKATGLSKGCAFVQFINKTDADECVQTIGNEEQGNSYKVNGRDILASIAGSRDDQKKLNKAKEKTHEKDDKRNLYLANEGLIRPGTQSAIGLSEIELNKRQKIEQAKRTKLKNPQIFVSKTRLCVHNIPRAINEQKLKEIFLNVMENKKVAKITEVRIMRDRNKLNEEGLGRSLGFAFVNFVEHQHALKALRELNNNPKIFSETKRPIVEFSLENKLAVAQKEQRKKRQLVKNELQQKMAVSTEDNADKPVMSRKAKRRERQKKFLERKAQEQAQAQSVPNIEKKSYQGSTGMTTSGKKLKMPKHSGPKIRKRNKGEVLEQIRISKKLNAKQRAPNLKLKERREKDKSVAKKSPSLLGQKRKISKDLKEDREFNKLVETYKKRFKMLA